MIRAGSAAGEAAAADTGRRSWSGVRRAVIARALLVGVILAVMSAVSVSALSEDTSGVERRLTAFIKDFYGGEDDIQVKFNSMPAFLKGKIRIRTVNFAKVPDAQGDGLCLVEFDAKDARERNAYVSFKVFKKKRLFVLKQGLKKGDVVTAQDVMEKETYLTGTTAYPASRDEVLGKRVRKDVPAGTIVTPQALEEQVLVQKGEIVNVTAENKRIAVHTSAKALDKGRMGETIRVKNLTSGKEVFGKVTGSNAVSVQF
jgi:flagella basal body P-ring formation protein FlgA